MYLDKGMGRGVLLTLLYNKLHFYAFKIKLYLFLLSIYDIKYDELNTGIHKFCYNHRIVIVRKLDDI